jgi:hypothetical protein
MKVGTMVMMNSSIAASSRGPDDPASAHYPDVLASLRAEAFGKGTDRLGECSKPSGQSECKTRTGTGGAEARTERKVRQAKNRSSGENHFPLFRGVDQAADNWRG